MTTRNLLEVEGLSVAFKGQKGLILDDVRLAIPDRGWTGLVGESGSGKSLTSLALLRLLPSGASILSGRAMLGGVDLLKLSHRELRNVRGRDVGMIFQNPRSALNPLMTVGDQIQRAAQNRGLKKAREVTLDLLRKVQMPDPELRAHAYPHQLSGGMCQRVLIAMMLATRPRLLIADEPTTGLDVTIQAEILELMHQLQEDTGTVILLISHDLGVIAENCEQVAVMYGGTVVEAAPARQLFSNPGHPYTAQLMTTLLRVDRPIDLSARAPRAEVPDLPSVGCRYALRCAHVLPRCRVDDVRLEAAGDDRLVACIRHSELAGLSVQARAAGQAAAS